MSSLTFLNQRLSNPSQAEIHITDLVNGKTRGDNGPTKNKPTDVKTLVKTSKKGPLPSETMNDNEVDGDKDVDVKTEQPFIVN